MEMVNAELSLNVHPRSSLQYYKWQGHVEGGREGKGWGRLQQLIPYFAKLEGLL